MEQYSCYHFEVKLEESNKINNTWKGWVYYIYTQTPYEFMVYRESEEWFDTEQEARFAAIGHIGLLENGEG
jgi:hypothetical protein